MLELQNIIKVYGQGENAVCALRGVSLSFRSSEFVSILGPSGCGKTTLLNIVGGLDRYSSGDLLIRNRSTKQFKASDWDAYRNNCVGFVFQNYNLIPHQTVLGNVELALTLSGVSKAERRKKAALALEKVGLSDQKHKRPNQLSGGQMQRVAIARAIVNDPEIILADEPTGALDSGTSTQVINLLKEIAKDRLVIMVTHNTELANAYSTRIINLLDGKVIGDTNPLTNSENSINNAQNSEKTAEISENRTQTPSITSKSAENIENTAKNAEKTANNAQNTEKTEDTITSTPTTPTATTSTQTTTPATLTPASPATNSKQGEKAGKASKARLKKTSMSFFTALNLSLRNLLTKKGRSILVSFAGSIGIIGIALVLAISNGFSIYIEKIERETLANFPVSIARVGIDLDAINSFEGDDSEQFPDSNSVGFYQPKSVMDVIGKPNNITKEFVEYVERIKDMTSSSSAYKGQSLALDVQKTYAVTMPMITFYEKAEYVRFVRGPRGSSGSLSNIFSGGAGSGLTEMLDNADFVRSQYDIIGGSFPEKYNEIMLVVDTSNRLSKDMARNLGFNETLSELDFNSIIGKTYKIITNELYYDLSGYDFETKTGTISKLDSSEQTELDEIFELGDDEGVITLTISGVMRERRDAVMALYGDGLAYLPQLTARYLESCADSTIAAAQAGQLAAEQLGERRILKALFSESELREDFFEAISFYEEMMAGIAEMPGGSTFLTLPKENQQAFLKSMLAGMEYYAGLDGATMDEFCEMFVYMGEAIDELRDEDKIAFGLPLFYFKEVLASGFLSIETAEGGVMQMLGVGGLPSTIFIYPRSFETKGEILKYLDAWNKANPGNVITYTDPAAMLSSTLGEMINIISYVLAAFAAVSLVVSSIMIGIITYVSVIERTKEIGVLRSIGARKKDIARVFNAETIIIGFTAGVMGVLIAFLLCIPINAIVGALAGSNLMSNIAILNPLHALGLVGISSGLTLISGLMPAIYASGRDPVIALRTE